jgi:Flp pilus assembly protein TadD
MKRIASFAVLASVLVASPTLALADATETNTSRVPAVASDYENAKKAIANQDWKAAIKSLEAAERSDPKDADVQNLLGYSHRKSGNLDAAFPHYARALELNPKHLGAHEYVGEAYLMAGKPAKAKEHLVLLEKFCPQGCEERDDLRKAIAEYERKAGR